MRKPRPSAWLPSDYDIADIAAIKALAAGNATESQQQRAVKWIVETVAATYDEPFRSELDGGSRETDFALGRAYVGRQIVKLINMPPALVAKLREKNG